MPSIIDRLREATRRLDATGLWSYAAVPLLLAALNWNKAVSVLADPSDLHFGLAFALPLPVTDAWAFVSTPTGGGVDVAGGASVFALGSTVVATVVHGLLAAGYLGGLRHRLAGDGLGFTESLRRYGAPFVGFAALLLLVVVPPIAFALVGALPLVLLWIPVAFALNYLFYAAPYLVVLHDEPIGAALSRSYALTAEGGPFFRFALGYLGAAVAVSVPATLVVVNVPLLGIVAGVVGLAPVGLVFDTATLRFVAAQTGADEVAYGSDGVDSLADENEDWVEPGSWGTDDSATDGR